jgi:hypothetical protein
MVEPSFQFLADIAVQDQLAIYAEVQRAADEWGVTFGRAFYRLMQRLNKASVIAAIEGITVEEAALKVGHG